MTEKCQQHGPIALTTEGRSPLWKFGCGCIGIPLYKASGSVQNEVQCITFFVCDTNEGDGFVFGIRDFDIKTVEAGVLLPMKEVETVIHKHMVRNGQGQMFSELTHILKNADWWDKRYREKD